MATKNIKKEAALTIKSLRKFHAQPVYIICDVETKRFLKQEGLSDNVSFKINAEEEHLEDVKSKFFKEHKCIANSVHKPECIFEKMNVMEFALENHDNTFFIDSDIVILDSLQENFTAKIVLSPHYYPTHILSHGFEHGFYNAGYLFCSSKGFPKFWRHIYLNDSTFFEQECMNRIPDYSRIQTFSREHNVGFWRRNEMPEKVKSFHFHISSGVNENRDDNLLKLNEDVKNYAKNYMIKNGHKDLVQYWERLTKPSKVAFVHFGKCAGVYINSYLKENVLRKYKKYMSWSPDLNPFGVSNRDWSEEELIKIAREASNNSYTHNHHINWTKRALEEYKANDWFTFTFLRRPEELLCSLFHWSKEKGVRLCSHRNEPENLEEIFRYAIEDEKFSKLWRIPEYIDLIDSVKEFNEKNFKSFLFDIFGENYKPQKRKNTSENKGFIYYREKGEITDRTAWEFLKHPEYEKYLKYLK